MLWWIVVIIERGKEEEKQFLEDPKFDFKLELNDPQSITSIHAHLFDPDSHYHTIDFTHAPAMPNLMTLDISRIAIRGLDHVLQTSPDLSLVRATIVADVFVYPPERYSPYDRFTIREDGGYYDMSDFEGKLIVKCKGVDYVRCRRIESKKGFYAKIAETDSRVVNAKYRIGTVTGCGGYFQSREDFTARKGKTIWQCLGMKEPGHSQAKNPYSATP